MEIMNKTENDAVTTENKMVKTTTVEILKRIKHLPTTLRHLESTPKTELPAVVVRYNPRQIGRINLRPNPKHNANADFRMLDSVITGNLLKPDQK